MGNLRGKVILLTEMFYCMFNFFVLFLLLVSLWVCSMLSVHTININTNLDRKEREEEQRVRLAVKRLVLKGGGDSSGEGGRGK